MSFSEIIDTVQQFSACPHCGSDAGLDVRVRKSGSFDYHFDFNGKYMAYDHDSNDSLHFGTLLRCEECNKVVARIAND